MEEFAGIFFVASGYGCQEYCDLKNIAILKNRTVVEVY